MSALRIMVVEDEPVNAMFLAEVLGGLGYDVCAVESTENDAVSAAARCKPDLMIVDFRLIHGTGVAAVEQILRNGFVPHVFISGDSYGVRILRPGAIVLEKPFREPDLIRAIELALGATAGA
jgi:CheY-like chemotaxis protein